MLPSNDDVSNNEKNDTDTTTPHEQTEHTAREKSSKDNDDDTDPTTPPEQNEQIPMEQASPERTTKEQEEPTIPQEQTVTQKLIETMQLHEKMQDSSTKQHVNDFEQEEEGKHDEDDDEPPLHICNHSGYAHGIGNLTKHDMSSYCKKGYRFYNVKCKGCDKTFVPHKPSTEEIKISGKNPLYACMNEKEKCTIAYCWPCVSLHYEAEKLKNEAEKLKKEAEKLKK